MAGPIATNGHGTTSPRRTGRVVCRLGLAIAVLAPMLVLASVAGALRSVTVHVAPHMGSPDTVIALSFRAPERTGAFGSSEREDLVTANAPNGRAGCVMNVDVRAPTARAGALVRLKLRPHRLGGKWCAGIYHGQIEEIQQAVCPRGTVCPAFVILRGIVGRFSFRINVPRGGDHVAPTFAGLERAFACTPGAQRPGHSTPYTLSWHPGADNVTPSAQLVYDVYYATRSRGENLTSPTWTTAPGVTMFRTPGLPSHASAYFVVRARDRAGNEDRNTVERAVLDPCY